MADSLVLVTVTDFVTVDPSSSTLRSTQASSAITPSTETNTMLSTVTTALSKQTGIPPLPSSWPTPVPPTPTPRSGPIVNLVLASIILVVILYVIVAGIGVLLWLRGKCPKCDGLARKLESGEAVPRITKSMVQKREALDAEKEAIQARRQTTLSRLDGTADRRVSEDSEESELPGYLKSFEDGSNDPQSEQRPATPGPSSGLGHGNPPPPIPQPPSASLQVPRPASSIYSRGTDDAPRPRSSRNSYANAMDYYHNRMKKY